MRIHEQIVNIHSHANMHTKNTRIQTCVHICALIYIQRHFPRHVHTYKHAQKHTHIHNVKICNAFKGYVFNFSDSLVR